MTETAGPAVPGRPITTLLVANRGEIARRVMRTARAMGIRTVAVHSTPDADAPHVAEADVAVHLPGATSTETYLDGAAIVAAARRSGADAVHPGYGFLSEQAAFAEACATAGLLFVGPDPATIRDMGLKDRAKDIARRAGVPVLPDAPVTGDDPRAWRTAATAVGIPLLVKATAGGGGRGMRRVDHLDDLEGAVTAARREAAASFGDDTVFLERYMDGARHVEVQVFGDHHGGAVDLLERECSIQRRHQKVVEEAPSPAVDPATRARMGATSLALVRRLGYVGAGTVEYLFDDRGDHGPEFWFLEMNTRLQVEHPVTEEITGLDLVRLQLEVAMGRPLGLTQSDIVARGHAIEVRLYAEDPAHDFRPSPGLLHRFAPVERPGVRWEIGVAAPGRITTHYDPMLAKVIAHGADRREATARLAGALDALQIHGPVTNRAFLGAVLRSEAFAAGQTTTDFVDRHPELRTPPPATPAVVLLAAAVAVTVAGRRAADATRAHLAPPGWRLLRGSPSPTTVWEDADDAEVTTVVAHHLDAASGSATLDLGVDGVDHRLGLRHLGPDGVRVTLDGVEHACAVRAYADGTVWVDGPAGGRGWRPRDPMPAPAGRATAAGPVAPLPGTVAAVLVAPGDQVRAGQALVVLEAMKMEHPVVADVAGTVTAVHVVPGAYVEARTVLVTLEEHA